ncbi:unnamed protein product [Prorocentrum cordatum]|uniref:Uncharacterized protein n=1 Tax=Prorocentrum cordatum TaxID=2364126 RepID=A0ABN9Q0R2_9DINO|nr:unnamed protein product [Polarella glacialis]
MYQLQLARVHIPVHRAVVGHGAAALRRGGLARPTALEHSGAGSVAHCLAGGCTRAQVGSLHHGGQCKGVSARAPGLAGSCRARGNA